MIDNNDTIRMKNTAFFPSVPGTVDDVSVGRNTIIRRATVHDADQLAALAYRTFEEAFGPDNDPDDMACYLTTAFTPEKIAAELKDPAALFLLVVQNDRLQGYAKLYAGQAPQNTHLPNLVKLVRLYVNHASIGHGLGAALMQTCLDTVHQAGYGALWLSVWEKNRRARDFYLKWGFHKIGTDVFVIGQDVQTDWIMARTVAPAL